VLRLAILIAAAVTTQAAALDLQGHRGARGLAPENTLPAFARALAIGVTTLELDAGITEDGVVVVCHDRRLNPDIARGTDGRWLVGRTRTIRELTFHELGRYDVGRIRPGSDYSTRFPSQRRMDGVRIPKLEDVFELARRAHNDEVRFNIETKLSPLAPDETAGPDEFARAVINVVRASHVERRTTIQSFDWRTLALVQREAPEIATAYLTSDAENVRDAGNGPSPWTNGIRLADHGSVPRMVAAAASAGPPGPPGGRIWSPNYRDLTAALAKEAKSLGLGVLPWTVNDPPDMERLIDWGVDGIITDYPDRLRDVMAAKRLPLPKATPASP
jgi:glycerophosphoryl diester phosphodiesterase